MHPKLFTCVPRYLSLPAALAAVLSLTAPLLQAAEPAASAETTLPLEPTVTVDLRTQQLEAEKAAALQRARAVAAARGASEPVRSIPEIDLVARQALRDLAAVPTRFDGAEAGWRLRSATPPELFAQRVIARLMRAGFSSAKRCSGEEWSGTHGESRVAVRLEARAVDVLLTQGAPACAGDAAP